jgi:signal transduction histidine kinase
MLAQLLDFSRVSSGNLQIYKQPEDLQAVCLTVITGIQRAQPQALVEVECKGPLDGVFDSNCIGQVFSNLILNALQHGQENGPVLIQLDGSDPLRLTTQVTNSGSFCSEVMTELFAPFRPGQSKEASGLGLGLYIVNQFVQAHGGEVQCHPQVDKTMFEFHIPRQGETTSTGVEDHVPISHPAP